MTKQQFLQAFKCQVDAREFNGTLYITTKVLNRQTGKQIGQITNDINIQEINDHIRDSHSMISLMSFNWNDVHDKTLRAQLTSIAIATPIDNYYPMDSSVDISDMYV
jgi:hypothetical protein